MLTSNSCQLVSWLNNYEKKIKKLPSKSGSRGEKINTNTKSAAKHNAGL